MTKQQHISLRVLRETVVFEPHDDMLVIALPYCNAALLRALGQELYNRAGALTKIIQGQKYRKVESEPKLPHEPHRVPDVHVHLPMRGGMSDG